MCVSPTFFRAESGEVQLHRRLALGGHMLEKLDRLPGRDISRSLLSGIVWQAVAPAHAMPGGQTASSCQALGTTRHSSLGLSQAPAQVKYPQSDVQAAMLSASRGCECECAQRAHHVCKLGQASPGCAALAQTLGLAAGILRQSLQLQHHAVPQPELLAMLGTGEGTEREQAVVAKQPQGSHTPAANAKASARTERSNPGQPCACSGAALIRALTQPLTRSFSSSAHSSMIAGTAAWQCCTSLSSRPGSLPVPHRLEKSGSAVCPAGCRTGGR